MNALCKNVARYLGILSTAIIALMVFDECANAQNTYPTKTINIIVPLPAGSGIDIVARLYADKMTKVLNVPVIVINRPGAGGVIAAQSVLNSPPDGYTLLLSNPGHSMLSQLVSGLPFDSIKDFSSITMIGDTPFVLVVPPSLNVRSVQDFVKLAKDKPGSINIATAGSGSATHVVAAYFAAAAGLDVVYVPYSSTGDLFSDVMSGRVQAFFPAIAPAIPYIQNKNLVALGLTDAKDESASIEIPSIQSQGIEYEITSWYSFSASAKTPLNILSSLDNALVSISQDEDLNANLRLQGITRRVLSLRDADARIIEESKRLAPVLKKIKETMKN